MVPQKGTLFQPTFAFPMVSVCVLVGAFLVYYFPITARQEASLNRRAFRSLALVSDSLTARTANYVEVLEQRSKRANGASAQQAGTDFAMTLGVVNRCKRAENLAVRVVAGTAGVRLECGGWTGTMAMDRILPTYLHGIELFDDVLLTDAEGAVMYQSIGSGSRIHSIRSAVLATVGSASTATSGEQAGGAENESSAAPTAPFAEASQSSTLVSTVIAGERYRLYLVPVPLRLPPATTASSHLILAGLMRESRFRSDSMALPGAALISGILLVLIVIVATWPLLKFATIAPNDRIPRRSAVYLFLSTLATIILVSILAIHLRYTVNLGSVDVNLERLAGSIERNLTGELKLALRVMTSATVRMLRTTEMPAPTARCSTVLATPERLGAPRVSGVLADREVRLSDYPYFDRIFWADSAGHQHVKWEAGRQTSPTYVGDRSYFVETAANRLWQFSDDAAGSARFRVDPIISRNTGEYRAVITQPAPKVPLCGDVSLQVVSMVTPLLSLIDPIMPPDYGFAIVDNEGAVLFHSNGSKNLQEQFVDEVEDNGGLRSALFARQGRYLTARYGGLRHRLFVTPLASLRDNPWSLIVFHNLAEGTAQHFDRIVLFSELAFAYFFGLAAVLWMVPTTRGPREWLWPREENHGRYLHLTLTAMLLAGPLYLLLFATVRPAAVLILAALVPAIVLGMVILKLMPARRAASRLAFAAVATVLLLVVWTEPQSPAYMFALVVIILGALCFLALDNVSVWLKERLRPPASNSASVGAAALARSYASVWAASLAMVALLPCFGFFRVAYDHHGNLSTRRQQVQTMAALAQREERVKAEYAERALTTAEDAGGAEVARWLFVRRRLEETRDRYDTDLLNPDTGQMFDPNTAREPCDGGLSHSVERVASLNPYADATLAAALASAAGRPTWGWCRDGVNRLRVNGRGSLTPADRDTQSLPPTRALLKSVTDDPHLLHSELVSELPVLPAWALPVPMGAILLAACLTFFWIRPTMAQLFLLKAGRESAFKEITFDVRTPLDHNTVLLTTDRGRVREVLDRRPTEVLVIDVVDLLHGAEPEFESSPQPVIAIDNIDYRNDDRDANLRKLELLERIEAKDPGRTIVLVAAVDPLFLFGAGTEAGHRLPGDGAPVAAEDDRWAAALARFTRVRVASKAATAGGEQARRAWAASTPTERVALHQLAHDGWVNPRNESALRQLERRDIIHGRPFRFTDPQLETFVADTFSARDRRAWGQQDSGSRWDGIRLMLVVVIMGVIGAALFFSQRSVLGLVATGLGILTPLTKLLSEAHSFRSLLGFGKAEK